MIKINEKCTGCFACSSICPYHAIVSKLDSEGFEYPVIDKNKCKNCGLCEKACPNLLPKESREPVYYAVQNKNKNQRKQSQSGGLFSALATVVIAEGGVCYGAGFIDNFNVAQIRVDDISDLYKLQGSKYVQSKVEHSYELVESDLRNKKKVLYSGTSCIIAGLLAFLSVKKVSTVGLITCDLICHGVPSPLLWKNNIERQTKKYGEIQSVNFRDKKNGWHSHIESYAFKNGKIIDEKFYTDLFYSHVALRKSCYECRYIKNEEKPADITMADFWGITEATIGIEDDNTGISLAVLRTDKGEELLRKSNLLVCNIDAVSAMVNNMNSPAKPPIWKEKFWRDYKAKGYEYCLKKYSIYGGLWFKIKRRVLKKMGKW